MTHDISRDTVPPFECSIRPAEQADARFIIETTAKVRQPRNMPWTAWEALAVPEATRRLATGKAWVAEADAVLLGFVLVNENGTVEMLYVKRGLRGNGIGKELLARLGDRMILARWPTPSWRAWTAKLGIKWRLPDSGRPAKVAAIAALHQAIDRYEAGEFD